VHTFSNKETPPAFVYRVDTAVGQMTQTWLQYQQQAHFGTLDGN
jgi:hypothetical protein